MDELIKERMLRNLKKQIADQWGGDGEQVLRELYLSTLNGKSFPESYVGEDILTDIQNKFYYFLDAIRSECDSFVELYIVPSYDAETVSIIILDDKILYRESRKAWHFWFDSEENLISSMYAIYRVLSAKTKKNYECYTLMDADIKAVADRKGLDLDGIDLDDVVHYIKKGISWALDDYRDEIIEDAIKQADDHSIYEPSSLEMQKAERRAMGLSGCQ